jgi:hypothetical protein
MLLLSHRSASGCPANFPAMLAKRHRIKSPAALSSWPEGAQGIKQQTHPNDDIPVQDERR